MFVNTNPYLLLVVIIIIMIIRVDSSRIFYLTQPKLHRIHDDRRLPQTQQEPELISNDEEFIPLSEIESDLSEKPNRKEFNFDWKTLLEKKANEYQQPDTDDILPEDFDLSQLAPLDRATRKPKKGRVYISNKDVDGTAQSPSQRAASQPSSESWMADSAGSRAERLESNTMLQSVERQKRRNDVVFLVIVGTSSLVGIVGLVAAAIFWYIVQKKTRMALEAEYTPYGPSAPDAGGMKMSPNTMVYDRKLAQSAQMFHYQQQRQQMMAQEKSQLDLKPVHSDDSEDEAPPGGDYTVYECPGLAPTGEMEVRNPLFAEPDSTSTPSTSASHPTINNHYPQPTSSSTSPPNEKSLS